MVKALHRRHRTIELLEPRQFLSTVTLSPGTGGEATGSVVFHVALGAAVDHDVVLAYKTAPVTATPGKDYSPKAGRLTIPAGDTTGDIVVPVRNDQRWESSEQFRLNVKVTGADVVKSSAVGTISDDDAAPTLRTKDVTVTEGDAGRRYAVIPVKLSAPAGSAITYSYKTSDETPYHGSATAGSDYVATSGTLTFAPGQTRANVRVPILGDAVREEDETFKLTFTNTAVLVLGATDPFALVTVKDNDAKKADAQAVLAVKDTAIMEGNDGGTLALVTVSLSRKSAQDVSFDYTYTPPDVSLAGRTVAGQREKAHATIKAGQTSTDLWIVVNGNTAYQANRTFLVRLSNVHNARAINGQGSVGAAVTVVDDEPVLFQDDAGSIVAAYSGQAFWGDRFLTTYDTGSMTVPVLHSPIVLVANRFDATNLGGLGNNAYLYTGSTASITGAITAVDHAQLLQGGTLNLGATNYYTGASTLGAGTLTLTGSGVVTTLSGTGAAGATLRINYAGDANLDGAVNADDYALIDRSYGGSFSGSSVQLSGLSKSGTGTLTLAGGSTTDTLVTGATFTSNGTLTLGGTNAYTSGLVIQGATGSSSNDNLNLVGGNVLVGGTVYGTIRISRATTFPSLPNLASSARMDIGSFPVTFTNADPARVRALLTTALSGGLWSGPGIGSSNLSTGPVSFGSQAYVVYLTTGQAPTNVGLGIGYAVQPDGSVLVEPALYGDANLDGTVDDADRALVESSIANGASPSWSAGDFNYDNAINADDLALLDRNLGRSI